ncbi:hypothetical protein [Pedobacter sp. ASV28]|uniref:hypothetical protein n=1 Tax=Pedobacter sp. ASV28 TaxID=2795123 RepID=UPI0018EA5637|nr:hypothetical protein [Pedobacter sp. ASV28]
MSQIKSLADELRETIKKDGQSKPKVRPAHKGKQEEKAENTVGPTLERLFDDILAFELDGNEKLLIRLNDKTVFLLKQLKIAKSIDMNKIIAYSLQDFLNRHPELIQYVKQNIKTIEL